MMRRKAQLLLVIFSLVPVPVLAADLTLSLQGDTQYDSNVFRRENNVDDDVLFHIVPGVELHEDRGQDANYSLEYRAPIRFAVEHNDRLQDFDQLVDGEIRYHVNDRMDIFASDDFRWLRTTVQLAELDLDSAAAGQGIPVLSTRDDRVTINIAELGTSYRFSPRLAGQLIGQHRYFDSTLENRQENWAAGAFGDLQYTLTPNHTVGLGVRYIHAKFEPSEDFVGSRSDTYNGFASWRYQVSESTVFEISAGPSYIDVQQEDAPILIPVPNAVPVGNVGANGVVFDFNSCPTVPGTSLRYIPSSGCRVVLLANATQRSNVDSENTALGTPWIISNPNPSGGSSDDLTVFAEAVLSQRWTPNLASALRYERSQGNASGLGGTVTLDAVSFSTLWDFAERWRFALRGDWTHRESVADVEQIFLLAQGFDVNAGIPPVALAAEYTTTAISGAPSTNRVETNRWGVAGRLNHRLWRNTNLFAELAFNRQNSKASTLGTFSDFDDFLATFGVRHVFEPIKLW